MSHNSDIAIIENPLQNELNIVINGWNICDITYDDDLLIKDKDTAVEIAKSIVTLLEFKFGEVKNEDFPNDMKLAPDVPCVEGYECPQFTEEEYEEYMEKNGQKMFDDFLESLMCDCD